MPRIDWIFAHDVNRWVAWIDENPCVKLVAIDAQTSKGGASSSWEQLLAGLEEFDRRTGGRLCYLINGPATEGRWAEIYSILSPERVTFTDARLHEAEPPTDQEKLLFSRPDGRGIDWGRCYPARVERRKANVLAAQELAFADAA